MERGRRRTFDIDEALDRALAVFWRDGFQGASLTDLTAAMGINKPSLYAAFGDKEQLYLKALERYAGMTLGTHLGALREEADARLALERFLRRIARTMTDPALPGGCFVVNGTADCRLNATPPAVQAALRNALHGTESHVRAHLQQARASGQLPPDADVRKLASFYNAVIAGMGVLAGSGDRRAKLDAVIDAAMACWGGGGHRSSGA